MSGQDLKNLIKIPTFVLSRPSDGKKIKYRPFLVKEEKALMIAKMAGEADGIIETLDSIIQDCTFGEESLATLSVQDYEFLMVQIGAKAKGEEIKLVQPCRERVPTTEENPEGLCGKMIPITADLSKIVVEPNPDHRHTIMLDEVNKLSLSMRDPVMGKMIRSIFDAKDAPNQIKLKFEMALGCIVSINNGEEVIETSSLTAKELEDFVDSLPSPYLKKISEYLDTLPKIYMEVPYECPCGKIKDVIKIEGLQSFLAY